MDEIPSYVLSQLSASEGEVLYHKRLTNSIAVYKNKKRKIRKHLLITSSSVILIDYYAFFFKHTEKFRGKDIIPIANIDTILCEMKRLFIAKHPFLKINTQKDIFEIAFPCLEKYVAEIREMVDLIKKVNANTQVTFDIRHTLHWM